MKRTVSVLGVICFAAATTAWATTFPLEFKTLSPSEAMALPGGTGISSSLQTAKPPGITSAPPSVSRRPLYGRLSGTASGLWYRLDESQGDGKGYDQLIVDLNRNGDLTDDAVFARVEQTTQTSATAQRKLALFGPVTMPDVKYLGPLQPVFYVQVYLYAPSSDSVVVARTSLSGYSQLKAGGYLEAAVEFDGVKHKVGIVDANGNFRLGDAHASPASRTIASTTLSFRSGDYFLQDHDGSGKFDCSLGSADLSPFGPILYLGAKPYKAGLAPDCKSLTLEPWTEPLAELALQPKAESVNSIQVAWESTPGNWQLLQPGLENARAKVPPGNYRLYACTLKVETPAGDALIARGLKRTAQNTLKAEAGGSVAFKCGAPLEIKTTSERDTRTGSSTTSGSGSGGVARILRSPGTSAPRQQRIAASITGAGGETYSSFMLAGKSGTREPTQPVFAVLTADGQQVGSGKMEFG